MYEVLVTADARADMLSLPIGIQRRIENIFNRLSGWPRVSGAKPLRHEFRGAYRIRTGDWRVLFRVDDVQNRVVVFRIAHRREVYE